MEAHISIAIVISMQGSYTAVRCRCLNLLKTKISCHVTKDTSAQDKKMVVTITPFLKVVVTGYHRHNIKFRLCS